MNYKDFPLYDCWGTRPPVPELIKCVEETIENMKKGFEFICHAAPDDRAGDYLRDYIDDSLGNFSTMTGWRQKVGLKSSARATRRARFAWLKWMLKNLKQELKDTKP